MTQQNDLAKQFEVAIVTKMVLRFEKAYAAIRPYLEKLPADKRELASDGLKHESPRTYLIYLALACDVPVDVALEMVQAECALGPRISHPVFQQWLQRKRAELKGVGDG
jgi:hypothetical protein